MDVNSGPDNGENYPTGIYIPQDDRLYLSSYRNGPKPANFTFAEVKRKIFIILIIRVICLII